MLTEEEVLKRIAGIIEKTKSYKDRAEKSESTVLELERIIEVRDRDIGYLKEKLQATENSKDDFAHKYNDLKEKSYHTIKHLVEDNIEVKEKELEEKDSQIENLRQEIKELEIKVAQFRDDFTDADMSNDKLMEANEQLQARIKELEDAKNKHDTTEDVDVMMTRIHTTDVDKSAVDETMEQIKKGEKLFKQYSFGVANKDTVEMFETFIHRLYDNAPLVGRYYILNKPENCIVELNKDACNSLIKHLLSNNIIENRDNEWLSNYFENDVIKIITKEC